MNLYLISQKVNNEYDTYDSAVVSAASAKKARNIHPNGNIDENWMHNEDFYKYNWCLPEDVTVKEIGVALGAVITVNGVICASFNAG